MKIKRKEREEEVEREIERERTKKKEKVFAFASLLITRSLVAAIPIDGRVDTDVHELSTVIDFASLAEGSYIQRTSERASRRCAVEVDKRMGMRYFVQTQVPLYDATVRRNKKKRGQGDKGETT